jgi:hypothetical protein
MIFVPLNGIDSQEMSLVTFKILSRISFRAQMDLTLFSTNQEEMSLEGIEIKAHTTSESIEESLLLVVNKALVLINYELKLDDLLGFELVLHESPVGNSTIRRDRVKVEILNILIIVPTNLPHWVSMLAGTNSRHVNWFVVTLKSDIKDHNSTIIKSNSE